MKQVAFFDLDNTMVHGSSLFFVARRLVAEGMLQRRSIARFALMEARFVLARTESIGDRDRITSDALNLVRGHSASEISALCSRVVDGLMTQRTVSATVHALREHQNAGAETWLVTASPIEVAGLIAHRLGMTGALATVPEIIDDHYTGWLQSGLMHGRRKAAAIEELARERGLDLTRATAYSDSEHDLPMLSLTGSAAVVNANRRLRSLARERGWQVLHASPINCERSLLRALQEGDALESTLAAPAYPPHLFLATR